MNPSEKKMSPAETKIRRAEANYTNTALDEMFGNVDDAKKARDNTKAAAKSVDEAWNPGAAQTQAAPAPTKPGFFARIATGFRNFGQRVAALFGSNTPAAPAPAQNQNAGIQAASRDRSDSVSESSEMQNNLNVTYTRAQGRSAAAELADRGMEDGKLNVADTRRKIGQASAQSGELGDDVADRKENLNVTMTRSDALKAAKALTKEHENERSHDHGHSL